MPTLSVTVAGPAGTTEARLPVERLVNCGWTGRDETALRAHLEELEAAGVTAPDEFPTLYPKPRHLITSTAEIEVASHRTSGEAEFVLIPHEDEVYVGVGSDHTDRDLETEDVALSKTVCPNVVGERMWRLADVESHWDEIELRSWTVRGGDRLPYQDGTLAEIRPPDELLEFVRDRITAPLQGTAVFSGSLGTLAGELVCGSEFSVELCDPVLDRRLTATYGVTPIDWLA